MVFSKVYNRVATLFKIMGKSLYDFTDRATLLA